MRRKDREITDRAEIESIISRALICRLAMADDVRPYVVPLCFGYRNNTLYFHSANKGKKLDMLKKNQQVCFEFEVDSEVQPNENACEWGMKYRSVIGYGKAYFLKDFQSKRKALDIIMRNYSDKSFEYPKSAIEKTTVIKVKIDQMTGKQSI